MRDANMRRRQRVKMKSNERHKSTSEPQTNISRLRESRCLKAKLVTSERETRAPLAGLNVIFIMKIALLTMFCLISSTNCYAGHTTLIAQSQVDGSTKSDLEQLINLLIELKNHSTGLTTGSQLVKRDERTEPHPFGNHLAAQPGTRQQLRKLLARPRHLLTSFVPHILSKPMILRRPLSRRPAAAPTNQQQQRQPPQNHRAPHGLASMDFVGVSKKPVPIARKMGSLVSSEQESTKPRGRRVPPERMVTEVLMGEPVAQKAGEQQQIVLLHGDGHSNPLEVAPMLRHQGDSIAHSETERGLNQIDQMIRKEFEMRADINEQQQAPPLSFNLSESQLGLQLVPMSSPHSLDNPNEARIYLALPGPYFAQSQSEQIGEAEDEHEATSSATTASLTPEQDTWRPTDYPPIQTEQVEQSPANVVRHLRHSKSPGPIRTSAYDGWPARPAGSVPSYGHEDGRLMGLTEKRQAGLVSAFVPSALETIAQLRLNQTNQHQQQPALAMGQSRQAPLMNQHQQHNYRTSLLNGKTLVPNGPSYEPMASENSLNQHQTRLIATVPPSPGQPDERFESMAHPGKRNWPAAAAASNYAEQTSAGAGAESRPSASSDLRETLKKLRETKARIRQLQAELNATQPGLFMSAAEPNKTVIQFEDEKTNGDHASRQPERPVGWPDDNRKLEAQASWFRSWSAPLNVTVGGGGGLFVPARMIKSQQSMNIPLGLYHKGPLTTPARLVASALGRAVHQSAGELQSQSESYKWPWPASHRTLPTSRPADQRAIRSSSAPILLSSTISVANEVDLSTTTTTTQSPQVANETQYSGGKTGHKRTEAEEAGSNSKPATTIESTNSETATRAATDSNELALLTTEKPSAVPTTMASITSSSPGPFSSAHFPEPSQGSRSDMPKPALVDYQQQPLPPPKRTPFMHNDGGRLIQHHQLDQHDKRLSIPIQHAKSSQSVPQQTPAATESPIVIVEPAPSASFRNLHQQHAQISQRKSIGLTRAIGSNKSQYLEQQPTITLDDKQNSTAAVSSAAQEESGSEQRQLDDRQPTKNRRQQVANADETSASGNFFTKAFNSFIELLRPSSAAATSTAAAISGHRLATEQPHHHHQHHQDSRATSVGKLTTERVVHSLILIVSSMALLTLLVVFTFVRCQQARRSRHQTLVSDSSAIGPGGGVDSSMFLKLNKTADRGARAHDSACPVAGLDWRRFGPMGLLVADQQRRQQEQQANKIILDGTMRNVSLLARHRLTSEHCSHHARKETVDSMGDMQQQRLPSPQRNQMCCHCAACNESWLSRAHQHQTNSAAAFHVASRAKLPFGAASSVNNMLQKASIAHQAGSESAKPNEMVPKALLAGVSSGGQTGSHKSGNQRAPIGGTRLRMMSAIDENLGEMAAQSELASDSNDSDAADFLANHRFRMVAGWPCGCRPTSFSQPQQQHHQADEACANQADAGTEAEHDPSSSFVILDRKQRQQQQQHQQQQQNCSARANSDHAPNCCERQNLRESRGEEKASGDCRQSCDIEESNNCACCEAGSSYETGGRVTGRTS